MRNHAVDSIAGKVEAAKNAEMAQQVPEGLKKLTKAEAIAWNQYIQARTDWKQSDLRTLHRLCRNGTKLGKIERQLMREPVMVETANGGMAANPIYALHEKMEKAIRDDIKLLGINTPAYVRKDPAKPAAPKRGKAAPVSLLK